MYIQMSILKFTAKAVGTVILTATGVTSHVANMVCDTCSKGGGDIPLFTAIENHSFDAIRKMWHPEQYEEDIESGAADNRSLQRIIDRKYQSLSMVQNMMRQSKNILEKAYENGSEEDQKKAQSLYDKLCEQYDTILNDIANLEDELKEQQLSQS